MGRKTGFEEDINSSLPQAPEVKPSVKINANSFDDDAKEFQGVGSLNIVTFIKGKLNEIKHY